MIGTLVVIAGAMRPVETSGATHTADVHVQLRDGMAHFVFNLLVIRAKQRLSDPGCDAVLREFTDAKGNRLDGVLATTGWTAPQFLSQVRWIDGADTPLCGRDNRLAAFTTPGSRAVFVCGARFTEGPLLHGELGELIVIHEMLHALGLGENPPSSQAITARVRARCGSAPSS